jgi:hypothetical protein
MGAARALGSSLACGLALGLVATALLLARNGLAPVQHPLTFGLVFGGYLTGAALLGALAFGAAAALAARLARRPAWGARAVACVSLAALAWLWWSNAKAARLAFDLGEPARFRWLLPAALVLASAALVLLALDLWRARRGARTRQLGLGGVLCAAGALLIALLPAHVIGRRAAPAPRPALPPSARPSSLPPLFVIGVDGADWRHIEPLIARGQLPHLAALRARGAWGPLATVQPTLSPIVWTTIATGRPPQRHGILGFTTPRLRGVEESLPGLHPLRGVGFDRLWSWLERREIIRQAPVTSRDRLVPAFWNLAERARSPVVLVHWWATWPAEPVFGFVISERAYAHGQQRGRAAEGDHGLTFPPELYRQIAGDVLRYSQVTPEDARAFMDVPQEQLVEALRHGRGHPADAVREFPYFFSLFESGRRHALDLVARARRTLGATPDLLVLFRLVDQTCHTALHHSELVREHPESTPEQQRRFGQAVSEAYRRVDRAVGELVAACGAACNVVVLSDHGFELEDFPGGLRRYHHQTAPDGILLAAGPAFRAGRADGVSVNDMLPLFAYLKGLPLARDLSGRLPEELLAPALLSASPPRAVDTYGTRLRPSDLASGAEAVDQEMLERLRALGYVQ